ncbi:MAG: hypothetical protein RLZ44_956 [Pseudomonadota bacterium]
MKSKYLVMPGLILVCALGLAACGGGGAKVEASTTTLGQELIDLDESYKKGLISEKEYKKARENILKRYK